MTLEYLKEQREKYKQKETYFENIGFGTLASDFKSVVNLINEMENYIKDNGFNIDNSSVNCK